MPLLVVEQPDRVLPPPDGSKKPTRIVFPIRNAGSAPLEITRVSSSCSCAVVSQPKKLLLAGEASAIEVLASPAPDGRTVVVTIKSNSASGPVSTLHIANGQPRARIERQVLLTSDWVYWSDLSEVGATQPFWIVTEVDRDASGSGESEELNVECSLPFLRVSRVNQKVERPAVDNRLELHRYEFEATVTELPTPGEYRGVINFQGYESFQLPVVCLIPKAAYASPSGIFLSELSPGQVAECSFDVQRRDGSSEEVEVVEAPLGVKVTRTEYGRGQPAFVASLSIPDGQHFVIGDIVLRCEIAGSSTEVRVPVTLIASTE